MSQHTTEDVNQMTTEEQSELIKKFQRTILTTVAIKVGVTVGVIVATKALARRLEKIEQNARK
ncbi:hypothetical protein CAPNMURICA_36 [Arthrobacter phage CapnMurica]|uniref:Uncharacterized protein n=2 Tax=Gordonvirus captnmurica TaxID=1982153 RepID=A0A386KQM0_9CAUD|nr:hypothetical protein FDH68_gp36 [Arthrobacter phage CaptnMurica]ALY08636.1 hypothetical protein CAPNMURICA_36 [Arthrobacter phage CaptnMurica]AYD87249.1 hypothetical protein SEA_TENNO_37 [Arthrobacter phage Tenno]